MAGDMLDIIAIAALVQQKHHHMFAGTAEKRNDWCLPIPHPRGSALLRREVGEARGMAIEVKL